MSATTFVASASDSSSGPGTLSISLPSGVQDSDLLIAWLQRTTRAEDPVTVPSGWTLVCKGNSTTSWVYYKIASSESGPYQWVWTYNSQQSGVICAYRGGFNTADPIDTYSNGAYEWNTPGTTLRATTATVSNDDSPILFLGRCDNVASSVTATLSGWTEDFDTYYVNPVEHMLYVAHNLVNAGATGNIDATLSSSVYLKEAVLVVLNFDPGVYIDAGDDLEVNFQCDTGDWHVFTPVPFAAGPNLEINFDFDTGDWTVTQIADPSSVLCGIQLLCDTGLWRYQVPSIDKISTTSLWDGQLATVQGSSYMDDAQVYLADGSVYATANKQAQVVTWQSEEEIEFRCDFGSIFSSGDTAYLFVVADGWVSDPYTVTLTTGSYSVDSVCHGLDPKSFLSNAYAKYNFDSFSHDSVGYVTWERFDATKDLQLGDGVDTSTMPALTDGSDGVTYYTFDGVNDYFGSWPNMPAAYTVCVAMSASYPSGQPYVQFYSDETIETLLTTPGAFAGTLHSLVIFPWFLSPLEKFYVEQHLLRRLVRNTHTDPYTSRMIRDEHCFLSFAFDQGDSTDYAQGDTPTTETDVTYSDGLQSSSSSGHIKFSNAWDYNSDEVTVFAVLEGFSGKLVQRGVNYNIDITAVVGLWVSIDVNGVSSGIIPAPNVQSIAVVMKDGELPIFYVNGTLEVTGTTPVDVTQCSADLYIGNDYLLSSQFSGKIKRLSIVNRMLSDMEILTLHRLTDDI